MNFLTSGANTQHAPIFDFLGSYFPSWIVCFLVGVVFTFLAHWVFVKAKLVRHLWPLPVVYPSLVCLVTFAAWLTFFK
jgi:hypothetical protein